jgi:lipopolysaccharide transport system ATP-binding protein
MSQPIIEIQGVGKRYRIGATKEPYLSLRDEVAKWFSPAARRARAAEEEFWALRDVSFSVEPGEAIGIIGRNGAGKSTLLKILSQITPPTEGKITMRGRVGSLLEVGTGFHPELTGRENIYMNGAILGMSRREIARKFDEIVAFAEMEKFLDTPVKRYSSGMYVRLAFAVAAHLEPEILVIDEVLAVGDAQFQDKCLGKMDEVARSGRTVLFVSHNMATISKLCVRAVLLQSGSVATSGATEDVISRYLEQSAGRGGTVVLSSLAADSSEDRPRFISCSLHSEDALAKDVFCVGEKMHVKIVAWFPTMQRKVKLSFIVKSLSKGYIYHIVATDGGFEPSNLCGEYEFTATFEKLKLYPGSYMIDHLWMANGNGEGLDVRTDVIVFRVEQGGPFLVRTLALHAGIVHEVLEWSSQKAAPGVT